MSDAASHHPYIPYAMKISNSQNGAPPWGSKGALNRAGQKIRENQRLTISEDMAFESWRAGHSYVLNTFKPLLWNRVRGSNIIVAQRLKRRSTIEDKLFREPKMELARMDDIAGCRLIFEDIEALEEFRERWHSSQFKHSMRHEENKDKYNYIESPKPSGYRGVHEIYTYNVNSAQGRVFNGLYVEMQFRTLCQHAWATAVEVISRITENQPKFDKGDDRHREFFRLSGEIIARTQEDRAGCKESLSDEELCKCYRELDAEINVFRFLRQLPILEQASRFKNNVVLQLSPHGRLMIHEYPNIDRATEGYFVLEKNNPNDDIVLVRAKTFNAVRSAYRNYFQNTEEFLHYLETGLSELENKVLLYGE